MWRSVGWTGVLAACGENHFATDEDWLRLDSARGETVTVLVHLTTTPEAWANAEFSDAVRLGFYPTREVDEANPAVRLSAPGREVIRFPGALNVLDAWDDCPRDEACERTVEIELLCRDERCAGGVYGEAYLSTKRGGSAPPDALDIELEPLL